MNDASGTGLTFDSVFGKVFYVMLDVIIDVCYDVPRCDCDDGYRRASLEVQGTDLVYVSTLIFVLIRANLQLLLKV